MSSFKNIFNKESIISRMQETKFHELVMEEISNEEFVSGLWGQALVQAQGEDKKALSLYIKLRVQSLKDEMLLGKIIEDEIEELESIERKKQNETESIQDKKERFSIEKQAIKDKLRSLKNQP